MGWDKIIDLFQQRAVRVEIAKGLRELRDLVNEQPIEHAKMLGSAPKPSEERVCVGQFSFAAKHDNIGSSISNFQSTSDYLASKSGGGQETFLQGFAAPDGRVFVKAEVFGKE